MTKRKCATTAGNFKTVKNHLLKVLGLVRLFPSLFTNANNIKT